MLKRGNRYIYYLVTKEKHFQKASYGALKRALRDMREHCRINKVKHLCTSRLGCGLDGLEWDHVSTLIQSIFKSLDIIVSVYYL